MSNNAHEDVNISNLEFDIEAQTVLKALSGSRAYGTAHANSDTDTRSLFVPPMNYYFGTDNVETIHIEKTDDTWFELHHFATMAYKGKIHAVEMLYAPDECVLYKDEAGQKLLDNRDIFLSKRLFFAYGFTAKHIAFDGLRETSHSHQELRDAHGYDTKAAMHAVRMLRTGAEFLNGTTRTIARADVQDLLSIKDGKYSKQDFATFETRIDPETKKKEYVITGGMLFDEYAKIEEAHARTTLPNLPNKEAVNALFVDVACTKLGLILSHERHR